MRIVHIAATTVGAPWLVELAREQKRRGHDVTLLIPSLEGTVPASLSGSGVICLPARVDILSGKGITDRALHLAKLTLLLRRLRPDVVHSHLLTSVVTARLASWVADVPIRLGMSAGPLELESDLLRELAIGTAFCDTSTIASCTHTFNLFEQYGIARRELIFYAANEHRFDPARADGARVRRELGVDDDTPLVGMVAYFYPLATNAAVYPTRMLGRGAKGHEVLLRAFVRVLERVPEAKLAMVGRGWGKQGDVYLRMMKRLARDLGIDRAVLFTGERSDVPDALAAFDVSVQPSLSDNLGGTLESLLMGAPLVVSDIPGYRDTIEPGVTGLSAPVGDSDALAEAIVRLIRDRDLARRLGENGRRRMLERFTLQRCADDIDELMDRSAAHSGQGYRLVTSLGRALAFPLRVLPVVVKAKQILKRRPAVRNPRIAQVAGAWTNCEWFVRLCRDLMGRGYDVIAVIDVFDGDLRQRLDDEGVRTYSVPMTFATRFDRLRVPAYALKAPVAALRLAGILRREAIDIVHSHIFPSVVIARIAAVLARAKHVAGIPGPRHLEARMTRVIDRLTWSLDDVTIAGCRYARDLYLASGADDERLDVVYYGADEERFDPARANPVAAREALRIANDAPLVALVANVYPPTRGPQTPPHLIGRGMKGHDDFVAAARIVAERIPAARFVVAGNGQVAKAEAYRAQLIAACRNDSVLRDRVLFAGRVEDVPSLLAAANVAVQCSLTESLGGTIEALLMERPLVATRVGGMPESVREVETGLLVPPSDPPALAEAIIYLLQHKEEAAAFGRAGRRLMLEHFTATKTADNVDRIYRRLTGGHAATAEEAAANA